MQQCSHGRYRRDRRCSVLAALYTPLYGFLDLDPLAAAELAICIGLGVALLVALEINKYFNRTSSTDQRVGH